MEWMAHFYTEGGPGMYPITMCLVFIFAIAIERIQFLYFKASIAKDAFVQAMRKYILAGNVGKALALCSQTPTPLSNIIKAGLVKVNKSDAEVQAAMDEASLRESPAHRVAHGVPRDARERRDARRSARHHLSV
jgi:biopolymer transport protein ExbB